MFVSSNRRRRKREPRLLTIRSSSLHQTKTQFLEAFDSVKSTFLLLAIFVSSLLHNESFFGLILHTLTVALFSFDYFTKNSPWADIKQFRSFYWPPKAIDEERWICLLFLRNTFFGCVAVWVSSLKSMVGIFFNYSRDLRDQISRQKLKFSEIFPDKQSFQNKFFKKTSQQNTLIDVVLLDVSGFWFAP